MFKVEKVEIDGFWHRFSAKCSFNEDVNIIIGKNGTGKTTFMNILQAILTVDLSGLAENDFQSAKIVLVDGKKKKTIKVSRVDDPSYRYQMLEYQISNNKYTLKLINADERRISSMIKRRLLEESAEVRELMESYVAISSLSVYRLRNDDEYEVRDRHGSTIISPVDYRLGQVLAGLTQFQLKLAEQAQEVSKELQKNVLTSILYSEDDLDQDDWGGDFDKDWEKKNLMSAYKQLISVDNKTSRKINFHVTAIEDSIKKSKDEESTELKPLEAFRKTRKIIDLSLDAKKETQKIYSQVELFLIIIKEFINDKDFSFSAGKLIITNDQGPLDHSKLSSGEKQLLILMVEALLQDNNKHVFLADEPELSLHIAWQRKIIPEIKRINPNAQIIVATHSPEVASKYKESIRNMEKLVNG